MLLHHCISRARARDYVIAIATQNQSDGRLSFPSKDEGQSKARARCKGKVKGKSQGKGEPRQRQEQGQQQGERCRMILER